MKFTPMKLIPLTQGKFAQVDDDMFEYLNQWKWYAIKGGHTFYAVREETIGENKGRQIKMHRFILGLEFGDKRMADHKDRNGLNNMGINIRACSAYENNTNSRKKKTDRSTSQYKGVTVRKDRYFDNKTQSYLFRKTYYRAHIRVKGYEKAIPLGYFQNELEAAKAYNEAAIKYHGEFAGINILYCNPCNISQNIITKYK